MLYNRAMPYVSYATPTLHLISCFRFEQKDTYLHLECDRPAEGLLRLCLVLLIYGAQGNGAIEKNER